MKFVAALGVFAALASPNTHAFTHKQLAQTPRSCVGLSSTRFPFLNYRFNKCPPINNEDRIFPFRDFYPKGVHRDVFPLLKSNYDNMLKEKESILRRETDSESVVLPNDPGLLEYKGRVVETFVAKADSVTGAQILPLFPGEENADVPGQFKTFWEEFQQVVNAQKQRRIGLQQFESDGTGLSPASSEEEKLYAWPELWYKQPANSLWPRNKPPKINTLLLDDVAKSVKGEFSNYHQQAFLRSISGADEDIVPVDLSTDMGQPFRSQLDFLGEPIRMAAINAWSLEMVGPVNFNLKWHFGVPRPEEVAWLIYLGRLNTEDHGVPEAIVHDIQNMNLQNATDFTAYPKDGSPMHPSFPAMHSAGSTCSLWVPAMYDLNPDQYLEALRTDYGVAFARTVAGVHYPQDNIAGLNVGQRVIRERLPGFLRDSFLYDYDLVQKKLEALSFDWNKVEFRDNACFIDGIRHDKFLQKATGGH